MEISYSLSSPNYVIDSVTIGFFDGCHLGHRRLLSRLSSYEGKSGVITFDIHPQTLLSSSSPMLITTIKEKLAIFANLSVDHTFVLPFTREFANQSAEEFLSLIHNTLRCKRLILGYDSRFGKDGLGNITSLCPLATILNIELMKIPPYYVDGEIVSSKKIREFLSRGDLVKANAFLGYPYQYSGEVIQGKRIGRCLGVPTINIQQQSALLPHGVYACEVVHKATYYQGIMNLGLAPTVQREGLVLEAHLFEFSGNLYGERVTVIPRKFIRAEQTFASKESLKQAMLKDTKVAKSFFNSPSYVKTV
ncbi:riboflavin biosynthesis protein RibF [Chlamydia ibidis]|uniref:Riboflavin biosynthesis protein n=2 Tax=Chlamydia ibidis TaxID=1405396 RepID=S7J5U3_9CHLA|nr:bifunctional riboflavin kinase/FAD synthetase [Chlamydia ibidis]EPP35623.1 riboflavin biosynthesis protein RibF [Chlamydia ibidis]EQM62801.1 riboflavin biosynthesis protein RibF [Chlamydia ibidis 10-1398/6]